jgi:hypothetical protein
MNRNARNQLPSQFILGQHSSQISQLSHGFQPWPSSVDNTNDDSNAIWQLCVTQQASLQKALSAQAQSM